MNFIQKDSNTVFPKKKNSYYELYSGNSCILHPLERKILSAGVFILTPANQYDGFWQNNSLRIEGNADFFMKTGVFVLPDIITEDCEIQLKIWNTNFPMELFDRAPNPHVGLFGSKNKVTIKPGEYLANLFVDKRGGI